MRKSDLPRMNALAYLVGTSATNKKVFRHRRQVGLSGYPCGRPILVVELPAELIVKIVSYLSFKEISQLRLVIKKLTFLGVGGYSLGGIQFISDPNSR